MRCHLSPHRQRREAGVSGRSKDMTPPTPSNPLVKRFNLDIKPLCHYIKYYFFFLSFHDVDVGVIGHQPSHYLFFTPTEDREEEPIVSCFIHFLTSYKTYDDIPTFSYCYYCLCERMLCCHSHCVRSREGGGRRSISPFLIPYILSTFLFLFPFLIQKQLTVTDGLVRQVASGEKALYNQFLFGSLFNRYFIFHRQIFFYFFSS